jgi:hypothetical protein
VLSEIRTTYDKCPECKCFGFVRNTDSSWCVGCRFRVTHNKDWARTIISNVDQEFDNRDVVEHLFLDNKDQGSDER